MTLLDARLRGIVTFVSESDKEYMFLFTGTQWTGEQSECSEGTLEWVPKEQVLSLPIWEGDRLFFRLLNEDSAFFSLKLVYDGDRLVSSELNGIPWGSDSV